MPMDPYWTGVRTTLARDCFGGAQILLPAADWDLPGRALRCYDSHGRIDIAGADLVVLHKGLIGGLPMAQLRGLLSDWTVIFTNEVFAVFSRAPVDAPPVNRTHLQPLKVHVDPRKFWRAAPCPCAFLHIPKTAGTSIWSRLAADIPASIYFATDAALQNFDGDLNAYELVGGHVLYRSLIAKGWSGPVFTTLRRPVDRLASYMRHSMRDRAMSGRLDTSHHEVIAFIDSGMPPATAQLFIQRMNEQSQMLGSDGDENLNDPRVQLRAAARALTRLEAGAIQFALVEDEARMTAQVARCFAVDARSLPRANTTTTNFDETRFKQHLAQQILDNAVACNDIGLYHAAHALTSASTSPG